MQSYIDINDTIMIQNCELLQSCTRFLCISLLYFQPAVSLDFNGIKIDCALTNGCNMPQIFFYKNITVKKMQLKISHIHFFPSLLVKLGVILFYNFCNVNLMFPWQLASCRNVQFQLGLITETVRGTHSYSALIRGFHLMYYQKKLIIIKNLIHQFL